MAASLRRGHNALAEGSRLNGLAAPYWLNDEPPRFGPPVAGCCGNIGEPIGAASGAGGAVKGAGGVVRGLGSEVKVRPPPAGAMLGEPVLTGRPVGAAGAVGQGGGEADGVPARPPGLESPLLAVVLVVAGVPKGAVPAPVVFVGRVNCPGVTAPGF
jgi:hypothetical protein